GTSLSAVRMSLSCSLVLNVARLSLTQSVRLMPTVTVRRSRFSSLTMARVERISLLLSMVLPVDVAYRFENLAVLNVDVEPEAFADGGQVRAQIVHNGGARYVRLEDHDVVETAAAAGKAGIQVGNVEPVLAQGGGNGGDQAALVGAAGGDHVR